MHPFRFALDTSVAPTMTAWRDRARMAEGLGYSAIYLNDHLGAQFGPLVAATVAAEATETLHVGMLVLNNDLRNPVVLAKEIASLGLAAEGRVEVGLGAGWLRSDYEEAGIAYDAAGVRVSRLAESVGLLQALWTAGAASLEGEHYRVCDARCDPRPETPPRLVIGGGSPRVLRLAARHADIVNIALPAGETAGDTAAKTNFEHYQRCLDTVREAAGDRFDSIELQISAFTVNVVGSARAATRTAAMLGFQAENALELPPLLIGSVDELCGRLEERRERWGFSSIVVPGDALETFAPVVARLAG